MKRTLSVFATLIMFTVLVFAQGNTKGINSEKLSSSSKPVKSADTLSTPNPSPEAVALYRYLRDMAGNKMLSGQMWAPWGIDEIDYVVNATGK